MRTVHGPSVLVGMLLTLAVVVIVAADHPQMEGSRGGETDCGPYQIIMNTGAKGVEGYLLNTHTGEAFWINNEKKKPVVID